MPQDLLETLRYAIGSRVQELNPGYQHLEAVEAFLHIILYYFVQFKLALSWIQLRTNEGRRTETLIYNIGSQELWRPAGGASD